MKEIPLTRGLVALVDDSDFEYLNQFKWCAQPSSKTRGKMCYYAGRRVGTRILLMHRVILGDPKDLMVDHRDANKLDNRRENLRVVTPSQNCQNQRTQQNKKLSRYKGVAYVSYLNQKNPWMAFITVDKKRTYLGYFPSETLAALNYNLAALKLHGEFACLNIIEEVA